MRVALIAYSRQFMLGNRYILTASKEKRKKMIFNDQLPTLSVGIVRDLNQRDLNRDHFLTVINDAIAESAHQTNKANIEEVNVMDLMDLVNQTHSACGNWFLLIASSDVEDAVEEVLMKG